MTDPVKLYEQLYFITLKMARDYASSSDDGWKPEILNVCSDGTQIYDEHSVSVVNGNLSKLCNDDPATPGSLAGALVFIDDYNFPPESIWGTEQVLNLKALCAIFGFDSYIGPTPPPE